MAQQNINFGTFPDDPNSDAIRNAFQKVQENFTDLYSGLQSQAVISVNKTPGAGLTVNSPTGNVVMTANIACVQVHTSTLSIGRDGNGSQYASITQSSQTLWVDLPDTISNVTNANLAGSLTANYVNANIGVNTVALAANNATIGNATANTQFGNGTINATGNANVGNLGTTSVVTSGGTVVNSNVTTGNVYANSGTVGAATLTASGNAVAGNVYANSGIVKGQYLYGDGSNITGVVAVTGPTIANGTSNVNIPASGGNVAISVASAIKANFTSTGVNVTGTGNFTGNLSAANLIGPHANGNSNVNIPAANGNINLTAVGNTTLVVTGTGVNVAGTMNATGNINGANLTGNLYGNGAAISSITGANVTGQVGYAGVANSVAGANVTGQVGFAAVANSVAGANVSGTVSAATTAGTVTTAAQPNITSTGTLTSVNSSGNITAPNVVANTGAFYGSGAGLTSIPGANVSGAVAYATTANSVAGANVSGAVSYATVANSVAGANVSGAVSYATVANSVAGANVSGTVSAATTAGTVTTAAQPNITSVGTLTSLSVTGNITAGNLLGVHANGNSNVGIPAANGNVNISAVGNANVLVVTGTGVNVAGTLNTGSGIITGNGSGLSAIAGANVTGQVGFAGVANSVAGANVSGAVAFATTANAVAGANVSGQVGFAAVANSVAGANVSGTVSAATTTGTVTTAAQPNITSVGTLSSLGVTGNVTAGNLLGVHANGNSNVNIPAANGNVNISAAGNANVLVVTGTGANITGTLRSTGNANVGNIGATQGVFTNVSGNGSALSSITGANVTGTVANATNATFVTGTAQPNITSLGTLGVLTVNGASQFPPAPGTGNIYADNANLGNLVTANFFQGDGGLLSNISVSAGTSIINGSSNLTVDASGNIRSSVAGNANIQVVTGTGVNVAGTLNATGNANVGNLGATTVVATLLGGSLTTNAQPNITSTGTLTGLTVSGVTNLGPISNVTITGGSANYFLRTDGAGVLSWINATTLTLAPGSNTQVLFNDAGSFAANTGLTFNKTNGNLAVSGNVNVTKDVVLTTSNISGVNVLTATTLTGNLSAGPQTGITTVGTLSALTVTGSIAAANITANLKGDGGNISNIQPGSINGQVSNALVAGTVYTSAQPNITSVSASFTNLTFASAQTISGNNITLTTGSASNNGTLIGNWTLSSTSKFQASDSNASNVLYGNGSFAALPSAYNNSSVATYLASFGSNTITTTGNITGGNFVGNLANGTSSVAIPTSGGNINIKAGGTTSLVVTSTGANVNGTLNATGNSVLSGSTTLGGTAITNAAWTTSGIGLIQQATTYTDSSTAVNGTIATAYMNYFAPQTYAASNTGVTVTNLIGTYFAVPGFGTNVTPTNRYALGADNLYVIGAFNIGNTTGALTGSIGGAATVNGQTKTLNIGTGGLSGSTTNINIGSANGTTTTINGNLTLAANSIVQLSGTGSNIQGANLVSATYLTGTLTTASQPNITGVGTITTGTWNNLIGSSAIFAAGLSGANLSSINASSITSGTLAQARLANSSFSINGTTVTLGGTSTITSNTTQALTLGSYLTGTSFNGGTAVTANVDATTTSTASKIVARDANANIYANNAVFTAITGDGSGLTSLNASSITSGVIGASYVPTLNQNTTGYAATVSGSAQANITSVSDSFDHLTLKANGNVTLSGASTQL